MRALPCVVVLAFAVIVASCTGDDPASLLASAKQYMAKRDFNASTIQLKNILQKEPDNAEVRYLLGLSALENGDLVSAEIELGKAAALGLDSDELQLALARALLMKGDANKLVAQFDAKTLRSPALQAELRALIGSAQLARNDRAQAQRAFGESLALDTANMSANLGMARLAALNRDLGGALARVDTALQNSPRSTEALLLKGDLLAIQGQAGPAETAYREAIRLSPGQIAPHLRLIAHLTGSRETDKAWTEVAALEKMAPKDPRISYTRAMLYAEERKFPEAREAILPMLKVAPNHVPSLILAGMAAYGTGAYPEAESHLRKAVFNAPDALGAKRLLAATHLRMGQTEIALGEVRELLARAGNDPAVVSLAGEAYLANGDVNGAARHYERAKSMLPDNVGLQTRLAQIRFATGEADRGMRELEAAAASDPQAYQADLSLIAAHLRQRQADKALEAVQALEKKQPDNPLTHNLRGLALILKRDFGGARASFEQALKLRPNYMPAVSNLARLDLREKNPEAAKKRYQAVVKAEPNNEQALLEFAVLLRVTGADSLQIEKLVKQSVAANPVSSNAHASLVNFYLRKGDYKLALAAAQEAQAALPNNPAMVQALGVTQLASGDTRQAIATFTRLSELARNSSEPQVQLAAAYLAAKQPDDAIKALRAALTLRPDLLAAQRDIAAIYVRSGRSDEALREAREIRTKYPERPIGYMLEGEIYAAQKQWDNAERSYRNTLKKFDLPSVMARAHTVIEASGKRAEADAMAENWIKANPKDTTLLAHLGDRDLAAKRYAEAAKRYQSALERQPDNPVLLNNLAWTANELRQPDALQYAERAHELAPQHPAIMDTLGWMLTQRGENERGLDLLGRAAELAPDAHEIRLHFAKALIKAQRKAAARKELEALAKLDSRLPVQKEAASLLQGL
jgi:putative PEP-CTERM system TPR-repeat lipoprotein